MKNAAWQLWERGVRKMWAKEQQGHKSCQKPAPAWSLHRVTASFGHPPAPAWGPPWAAGGYLLHRGPPWATEGQPASPWSSPGAAGESLLWHLEHLLPLLLCWPWCLQSCFSHIFSLLSPAANRPDFFFPFLNMLSQRHYLHCWWAQPWPAAGRSRSWLALGLSDMGGIFWQLVTEATPVAPPYQNLATQSQYSTRQSDKVKSPQYHTVN